MIIDFHTHIFPDKIAERTVEVLKDNVEKVQGFRHQAYTKATVEDLKRSMRENSIDYSVVLPIATVPKQTGNINSFASEINGKDNIFSFGSLHPIQDDYEEILEKVKKAGLPGIKLHPEYQQFFIDSPEAVRILKKCEELELYVVLHAGQDIGILPPVHCTPERLAHVLDYVKGDKLIAAHLGGWKEWNDVEKYIVGTPIKLDTAFIADYIPKEQLLRIIQNHGSDKILFGTDSPWSDQGYDTDYLMDLGLTKSDLDNVLYKNAQKILNLS